MQYSSRASAGYDADCDASPQAGRQMEKLGYERGLDYEPGKQAWKQAGLSVVR